MREGYKKTVLGEIPEDWEVEELNKVTSYVDYRGKTPPKVKAGILLVTAKNIRKGRIDYSISKEYVPIELYETVMSRGKPKIGDVLITTEAPLGNVASVDDENVALAQRVIKYRGVNGALVNSYLKHFMLGPLFQDLLDKESTGSTVKGIKGSRLHKLKILLPPLPEQQKIANILSTVDEKIELIDQQISETGQLKKGLMQKLLTKGIGHTKFKDSELGEIPESWEVVKLGEIAEIIDPQPDHRTPAEVENGIPYIGMGDIKNGKLNFEQARKVSQEALNKQIESFNIYPEAFVFGKIGTIGNPTLIPSERFFALSANLILMTTADKSTAHFLYVIIQSDLINNQLKLMTNTTSQPALGIKKARELKIPFPPEIEQQKVAKILSTVDEKLEVLHDKKAGYQELKKGLMQVLLTGKVRVNVKN